MFSRHHTPLDRELDSLRLCTLLERSVVAQEVTHCSFPEDFKAAARALLFAHRRLERAEAQRSAAAAGDQLLEPTAQLEDPTQEQADNMAQPAGTTMQSVTTIEQLAKSMVRPVTSDVESTDGGAAGSRSCVATGVAAPCVSQPCAAAAAPTQAVPDAEAATAREGPSPARLFRPVQAITPAGVSAVHQPPPAMVADRAAVSARERSAPGAYSSASTEPAAAPAAVELAALRPLGSWSSMCGGARELGSWLLQRLVPVKCAYETRLQKLGLPPCTVGL